MWLHMLVRSTTKWGLSATLNQIIKVHKEILETCRTARSLCSPKICSVVWRFGSDHTDQREFEMTREGSGETHTTADVTLEAICSKCLSLTRLKSLSSGAGGRDYGCHSILLLQQWWVLLHSFGMGMSGTEGTSRWKRLSRYFFSDT